MTPTVGRIVHYVNHDGVHCAAVICCVHSETQINLTEFTVHGSCIGHLAVFYSANGERYTWHWPERE